MCVPIGSYDSVILGDESARALKKKAAGNKKAKLFGNPKALAQKAKQEKLESQATKRLLISDTSAPSPFAIFGPRIGVDHISDVMPGQRGRSVSVSDLKIGLP